MLKSDPEEFGFNTRAVHAGQRRTNEGEQSEPIFLSSSFCFDSAAQAAARFSGEEPGNLYSRFTNPTVRVFEQRLATLEGGERCVATSSGMAAIMATCMGVLRAGDHIVASRSLFGSTILLFENILGRFGVETTFVSLTDVTAWATAIRPNTRLLFIETPANPLTEVADIPALAALAHAHECLLVVDNVFCTPVLQRPLELGADIVVHSATKYIDGQGRCIGGAVVGSEAVVGTQVYGYLRTAGSCLSPFNAWVFAHGLETLSLRMQAHCRNAQLIAEWLQQQRRITRVNYPGLPSHPQHALAARQQSGFGGIISFDVAGGRDAAWKLIDAVQLISITANLGDAKSTITHPATTTHGRMSADARRTAGIGDGLVRISVGLEDAADLIADLERAIGR
ncbi:MAG: O-succinylhomoserine sulfhydrylase [Gammaproteobacteria bacterium]|nr:MAG: O-succinylhomoserine sulfhydrylase [Gammaproteobacteria bacterium]TND07390.1 MAG: O-succinylhomoserine sulfhydrylase [Gammaproteobacteria bacterium]